jgi:hypothetical protein
VIPLPPCATRLAEDVRKEAEKQRMFTEAVAAEVQKQISAERRANAQADANAKAGATDQKHDSGAAPPNPAAEAPKPPSVALDADDTLPPIIVPEPSPRQRPARGAPPLRGDHFVLSSGYSYRIEPAINFTTTIHVRRGALTLIMDGTPKLHCPEGQSFRVFTQGYSTFDLESDSEGAELEIAELVASDNIVMSR